ncbi:ABC transporter permease [Paenibacillus radicis (ex Gao et al. 2016)]|uniref:Glycine/betaine ABC transporter permease n=1 Tax=Paenibacillus radicis (ex Gao et al. 2016) TaxID=1737354 RepID=A0A917H2B7_9BACL|nr:ABC transporter permease [Paenibacillus radicis (ex Gao et al. 2016)]GGG65344.1 glycine/betaine ABC transporter permease [Paenibacillus radicis (ex Gao et al. 2016)]
MDYAIKHYDQLLLLTVQHIFLTLATLVIALLIALPVSLLLLRVQAFTIPVLAALGLVYVVPSMAMFAFLVPLVGVGITPALIALIAYSQLFLVRNLLAGFKSINPSIIEAGRGMGLGSLRLFWRIELPLALPIIIGGIRLTITTTIGIATIASWINAGGLGVLLFDGLYQNNPAKIIWGALLVSGMAILSNQLLFRLERKALRRAKGEVSL